MRVIEIGDIVWVVLVVFLHVLAQPRAAWPAMTDLQWFALIYLPIGVCLFGMLLAAAGVAPDKRAADRQDRQRPTALIGPPRPSAGSQTCSAILICEH